MWRRPACQTLSNINNNISFHFRLFQGKANDNLKIIKKNLFQGHFGPFCQFINISIIYHPAKNQKKLMTHSWEKCQTDKQTNNSDFLAYFLFFPLLCFHWCRLAYSNENCWEDCPLGITTTTKLVATIKPFHVSFWYISSNDNISIN